jgi:plasmid stabilization system protein ParE
MKFTVVWRPAAKRALIDLWTAGLDRNSVAKAADEIDACLGRDASLVGESRWGATRILVEPPLAVYFDVSEDDRMATVWAVWRSK